MKLEAIKNNLAGGSFQALVVRNFGSPEQKVLGKVTNNGDFFPNAQTLSVGDLHDVATILLDFAVPVGSC
jgi:hypothetical protein